MSNTMTAATPTVRRGGPKVGIRLSFKPMDAMLRLRDIEADMMPVRLANAVRKGRSLDFLTLTIADEIACDVLGIHPHEVWGREYEEKVWFDMHDGEPETVETDNVIQFPTFERVEFDAPIAVAA